MIRIENYCKPDWKERIGIPHAFEEDIDGEIKPCPLCKRIPKPMVRTDSTGGYFSAVSCFGGKGLSHAYVCVKKHAKHMDVLNAAIEKWNNGIIEIRDEDWKRHLYSRKTETVIEDCCKTCAHCRYIKTPSVTGNYVDYVCDLKGSVVYDIDIRNCDEMYEPRKQKG